MDFSSQDILNIASQDIILANSTVEEQVDFISEQIENPFDSGSSNFFKKLKKSVSSPDKLDEICLELLGKIEDVYPDIEFDLSEYDQHLDELFSAVYKFFVKNAYKVIYVFMKEYISSSKNRKALTADYLNAKIPTYPKEQYGKKEYYILTMKLPNIMKDIRNDGVWLDKFIGYLERSGETPMYIERIKEYLDKGIINDHGVIANMLSTLFESDSYTQMICKLQSFITEDIVIPYLKENGLIELRLPPVDPEDDDLDEDDEDANDEEDT